MVCRFLCSVVILGMAVSVAQAETLKGYRLFGIEDGKITVKKFDRKAKKLGEAKVFELAEACKVCQVSGKKGSLKKEPWEGGLKAKIFRKFGKTGRPVILTVEDGKVTEISIRTRGKKKKKTDG